MPRIALFILLFSLLFVYSCDDAPSIKEGPDPPIEVFKDTIRFASYNVSLFENASGKLLPKLLSAEQNIKLNKIKAVIQKVAPDVLVLMEIDYDSTSAIIEAFNDMLSVPATDQLEAISYPYHYQVVSNTGELAQIDIDGNGEISLPNDAYGFGMYHGQYASAILSKFPLAIDEVRSFKNLLWKDLDNASLPVNPDGTSYYSDDVLAQFRLSSKNHIDLPILLPDGRKVHALISHPTPPVFDGLEDRNGRRNHDEIKLWADYLSNNPNLTDDKNNSGGLLADDLFVLFGDQNADPNDGDSYNDAMLQILNHSRIHAAVANGNLIPSSNGGASHNQQAGDEGDPKYDTSFFGLRIDYVLPCNNSRPIDSGVFWPSEGEEGVEWVRDSGASDHLLVWLDVTFD